MKSERLKGNLDLLLLSVLSAGPAHGYVVITALHSRSAGTFDLPEGTVYPALHRLERAGLLGSSWSETDGRKRRVYALTRGPGCCWRSSACSPSRPKYWFYSGARVGRLWDWDGFGTVILAGQYAAMLAGAGRVLRVLTGLAQPAPGSGPSTETTLAQPVRG